MYQAIIPVPTRTAKILDWVHDCNCDLIYIIQFCNSSFIWAMTMSLKSLTLISMIL